MAGSWTIQVIKRDSSVEPFSISKLRLCLFRVMGTEAKHFTAAGHLAQAVRAYLRSNRRRAVTSRAIFEMALRVLRRTGHDGAAEAMESAHLRRLLGRHRCEMVYEDGRRVRWNRSWVVEQFRRRWDIAAPTARALSAEIEQRILQGPASVGRQELLDSIDELVDQVGLTPWCHMAAMGRG